MIKTSNKLIGEIENNNLYASDDEGGALLDKMNDEELRG
jgi:hypothetical protein